MKHFHLNRLEKLADFLYTVPRQKWDFATIMDLGDNEPLVALAAGNKKCGTAGCAVGWAPALFRRDLKWEKTSSWSHNMLVVFRDPALRRAAKKSPTGELWGTVGAYFGLTYRESLYLFNPGGYWFNGVGEPADDDAKYENALTGNSTAKQVANHIRRFVKDKRKELAQPVAA